MLVKLDYAGLDHPAFNLIIRRPRGFHHTERKPAAPARDSGKLPAADQCIEDRARATAKRLSLANRKFIDPICGDEVTGVEVGHCPVESWLEAVQDFAEARALLKDARLVEEFAGALRVRAEIDRVRKRVAEVELKPVRHRMTQDELACVVAARSNRGPGIKRRKLILIEAIPLAAATRVACYIEKVERACFIPPVSRPYIGIDVLRRAVTPTRCIRKHIFKVGNRWHSGQAVAQISVDK